MRKAGYLSVGSRRDSPKSWLVSWESKRAKPVNDPGMIRVALGGGY